MRKAVSALCGVLLGVLFGLLFGGFSATAGSDMTPIATGTTVVSVQTATGTTQLEGWTDTDNGRQYVYADGSVATGVTRIDGVTYFFDENGVEQTGWQTSGGVRYYYSAETGLAMTGTQRVNGVWYLFDYTGAQKVGWRTVNGVRRYYNPKTGRAQYGWIESGGWRYYASQNTGKEQGETTIGGVRYQFDETYGTQNLGFCTFEDGTVSYYNEKGAIVTNWQTLGESRYYFGTNGVMRTSWQTIDGNLYYFQASGALLTNTRFEDYTIDENGVATEFHYEKAVAVLDEVGWDLRAAFDWSAGLTYYGHNSVMPSSPDPGMEWFADYGFDNLKGNCYVMAATFCEMAIELGYDAAQIAGEVPLARGGMGPHSWVEIVIDGETYVYDPDFTNETGRDGFHITYGQSGTWRYVRQQVMSD